MSLSRPLNSVLFIGLLGLVSAGASARSLFPVSSLSYISCPTSLRATIVETFDYSRGAGSERQGAQAKAVALAQSSADQTGRTMFVSDQANGYVVYSCEAK